MPPIFGTMHERTGYLADTTNGVAARCRTRNRGQDEFVAPTLKVSARLRCAARRVRCPTFRMMVRREQWWFVRRRVESAWVMTLWALSETLGPRSDRTHHDSDVYGKMCHQCGFTCQESEWYNWTMYMNRVAHCRSGYTKLSAQK